MTEPTTDQEEIRDFTIAMKPHRFRIDADVFAAPAILSPVALKRMAGMHAALQGAGGAAALDNVEAMLSTFSEIFKVLLPGSSGQRFAARLEADGSQPDLKAMAEAHGTEPRLVAEEIALGSFPESEIIYLQPIDLLRQAMPAFYWLLEQYGMRPTQQSSPLPSDSGTGALTDGAPETAPTGEASLAPINS